MSLRNAVDSIEVTKRRIHMNCHVPFVMAILRISDYLQIQSTRAPGQLLALKSLSSPISRGEWKKHASVREIHQAHDDPESIFVDCEPESASIFVDMRRLFTDIQQELDGCWAVIGEVYGRVSALSGLGITVRRIRSNIDNPADFQRLRHPPYIPKEFRFRTASTELMDLLIAPLYGNKPEIGIRELIQNSVDACLERDELIRRGIFSLPEGSDEDVIVTIDKTNDGASKIIIEDFGVGMTIDVIEKYFLNIGASFRSSDLWRRSFEIEGHSTIHRTGRFGIGVLAAFLLGPRIKVTTRHISEPDDSGISFSCEQGDEIIELSPCEFHHGTKIEIDISTQTESNLLPSSYKIQNWDWYCLNSPTVKRQIITKESIKQLDQRITMPACDADLASTPWRRVTVPGYDDIMWTYSYPGIQYYERLVTCNGILIERSYYRRIPPISGDLHAINASPPTLAIFDPDGRLPLNLQRSSISGDISDISAALAADISIYFSTRLAEKFRSLPPGVNRDLVSLTIEPDVPGLNHLDSPSTSLAVACILPNGVVPTDLDLLSEVAPPQLIIDPTNIQAGRGAFNSIQVRNSGIAYIAVDAVTATKRSRTAFLRSCLGGTDINYRSVSAISILPAIGRRILIRKADVKELVSPGNVPRTLWAGLVIEQDLGEWCVWAGGDVQPTQINFSDLASNLSQTGSFGVVLLDLDWKKRPTKIESIQPSTFSRSWREIVRSAVLIQTIG